MKSQLERLDKLQEQESQLMRLRRKYVTSVCCVVGVALPV